MNELKDLNRLEGLVDQVLDKVEDLSGVRLWEYKEDGVYLIIYPPKGKGKPVSLETIKREAVERSIDNVNWSAVEEAVENPKAIPVKIAGIQPDFIQDGSLNITVNSDKMTAEMVVYPPKGGKAVTFEKAMAALAEAGVVYGIEEEKVCKALEMSHVSEKLVVANGLPLINGIDAKIDYKFNITGIEVKPKELADGRADFYNLNLIQNVVKGQILVVKSPPTQGTDGMTVTGQPLIAKPGKDKLIKAGKNTELMDDDTTLIATAAGHVLYTGGKVGVYPVFEVNGDVDFTSGNIDFVGSVIIKGSVRQGFSVKAAGDVEVNGSIGGGSVIAGGHLKVKDGIFSNKDKTPVTAQGNIFAKFIENAEVESNGDITVGEAIMHSRIIAKGSVRVGGRKGLIVGGLVRAGDEISAKIIGSNYATATELEAGVNPELRKQYEETTAQLKGTEISLDKAQKALTLLKHLEQAQGLAEDKKVMLVKVTRSYHQLTANAQELREKVQELENQLQESERGRVMVEGIIHPGVKVTIGTSILHVRDNIQYACLTREDQEVKVGSFR
ncbi:MAG: FapA family protein [Clostridia bacterium]|nr:FapA family protein [Clostridia bacterium]